MTFNVGDLVVCRDSIRKVVRRYVIYGGQIILHVEDTNGGIEPVSESTCEAYVPDTTRIITGETHAWKGIELTSGAGQIELVAVSSKSVATVTLTEEQAEQLAGDLHKRVNRMRNLKPEGTE